MSVDYQTMARRVAQQVGVPVPLFMRLIQQESGWRPQVKSPAGAIGLTQLMPGTARGLGVNPYDPQQNLMGGARYLKQQLGAFGGDPRLALAAYNAGPGAVQKYGGIPPYKETQNYVRSIMGALGSQPQLGTTPSGGIPAANPAPIGAPAVSSPGNILVQGLAAGKDIYDIIPDVLQARRNITLPVRVGEKNLKVQADRGVSPSPNTSAIVKEAVKFLGTPYSWGGGGVGGPSRGFGRGAGTVGFDCSSFIQYLNAKQGKSVPRVTYDQWRTGAAISPDQLQPGDAVFFRPGARGPEHVGMYIGNGQYIHAPKTGDVIKISNLAGRKDYMGARRY